MKKLPTSKPGFTLIELLVVISIMVMLTAALTLDLGSQRSARDIRIAQNQLVSDIRKAQSYTLSSRTLSSNQSVQYYILKFDLTNPSQYSIQAISDTSSGQPKLKTIETIIFPPNIQIAAVAPALPVVVTQRLNLSTQKIFTNCALLAFAAPFAKIIFNDGCSIPTAPLVDQTNPDDDYNKIVNFVTNVACGSFNGNPADPSVCSASTDSLMTITLMDTSGTVSKKILINAISGLVCPTLNNTNPPICQLSD